MFYCPSFHRISPLEKLLHPCKYPCRIPFNYFRIRQRAQKNSAIAFVQHAPVEDQYRSAVITTPDQASEALAEFDNRLGHGKITEGIAAVCFYFFCPLQSIAAEFESMEGLLDDILDTCYSRYSVTNVAL